MAQTAALLLLLLLAFPPTSFAGKYVLVERRSSWRDAQAYCRRHHTDLAPVANRRDQGRLQKLSADSFDFFWIGLQRNLTDKRRWSWSGGGEVSEFLWAWTQPDDRAGQDYGVTHQFGWHDADGSYRLSFFCFGVTVVRQRKTWIEALRYCRDHHGDLASVASETETTFIKKELDKNQTSDRLWIGLRHFPGGWLWTDGQRMAYDDGWSPEGAPACPEATAACGALRIRRRQSQTLEQGEDVEEVGGQVEETTWEAHDCEDRLHFICY